MKLRNTLIPFLIISISLAVSAQTINFKIVETSDVHGAIFPYDLKNDRERNHSLAQVTSFLKEQREKDDHVLILLDNGDILQGDPAVYYYNFEKADTIHLYADVMNFMKYDAATVGNHDIETGHPVYDKFNKELNFPWLAANAVDEKTGEPYFKPYTVIKREGIKIVVLGLITPAIPNWLPPKIWEGIYFEDMLVSAEKWVKKIRGEEQPDLLIGLFHSGIDYTYNDQTKETEKNENAAQLVAEQVRGFDIVFVGHDHAQWNFKTENSAGDSVLILGPTSGARTIAVAELKLNYNKMCDLWEIEKLEGSIVNTKDYSPDTEFMKQFSPAFYEAKEYVNRPIGKFTKTISAKESLFGPSEFVDLIHAIQLELTDADVSFVSPLSFNAEIKEGDVYVKDMFNLYRYENLLYTMELTGKEIDGYLEFSYANWFNKMKSEDDHLLKFKKDEEGNILYSERSQSPQLEERYYNYSSAEGINYAIDVTKPAGERVTISSFYNGEQFDLNKTYKVAVNSYRGNGGGGHLTIGAGIPKDELANRIVNSTEKDLRYYLMKWIENEKIVEPKIIDNWKVVPESFWENGKKKDYKILFE